MTDQEATIESFDDGNVILHSTKYGMWQARDKDGNNLCSSISKEDALFWAREQLNGYQNSYTIVTNTRFEGQDMLK